MLNKYAYSAAFAFFGLVLIVFYYSLFLKSDEEKEACCIAAKKAEADFVKTSTGFGTGGATKEDIALMRKTVGPEMGVKASGGVRTLEDLEVMVEAGATRIGASAGIAIMQALKEKGEN